MKRREIGWGLICIAVLIIYLRTAYVLMIQADGLMPIRVNDYSQSVQVAQEEIFDIEDEEIPGGAIKLPDQEGWKVLILASGVLVVGLGLYSSNKQSGD